MNGKEIIAALEEFVANVRAGKPIRQHTLRRMKVKGKNVYVQSAFTAPVKLRKK